MSEQLPDMLIAGARCMQPGDAGVTEAMED